MEFETQKKEPLTTASAPQESRAAAYEFAKKAYKEFGSFLKAIVLFGSSTRANSNPDDIDILLIVDDVTYYLGADVVEAYRIIIEKIIAETSTKIHVTTLRFTSFWEYLRAGDPIGVNILRTGIALLDTGFFEPMQRLLVQGRIRPSIESVWAYFSRAPQTLQNSRWHLMQAVIDLYWAVIDSAHAALMEIGEIPPSPNHVADLLDQKLVKKHLINKKHIETMKLFYSVSKKIARRELKDIKGLEYEIYYKKAREFVDEMKKFIDKKEFPSKSKPSV